MNGREIAILQSYGVECYSCGRRVVILDSRPVASAPKGWSRAAWRDDSWLCPDHERENEDNWNPCEVDHFAVIEVKP